MKSTSPIQPSTHTHTDAQPSLVTGEGHFHPVVAADHRLQLLLSGAACLDALENLIRQAERSVCIEMYIFKADATGERIRAALLDACTRGVNVRILLDDYGSHELSKDYFVELLKQGARIRRFNASPVLRVAFRNHRKLCIADNRTAIVGGFNVGDDYSGDGMHRGWFDLGLQISGALAISLTTSFDRMFIASRMDAKAMMLFIRGMRRDPPPANEPGLLTSGPAFGGASMRRTLYAELAKATRVDIITAYFSPTWLLQRRLLSAASRGQVRLVLPGKSDVPVMRLAGQHLYTRLLRGRVRIFEYQPQVLHAKLLVIDDVVYVGSCNLDTRSLRINFELLVRIPNPIIADQARRLVTAAIAQSNAIELTAWTQSLTWWGRLARQFAFWLAIRFDMFLVRRKWRAMR